MTNNYGEELDLLRSLLIVTSLQLRRDLRVRDEIEAFGEPLVWEPLSQYMIDRDVWNYSVVEKEFSPRLVFAHPDILQANPIVGLYYRGMCGISLKMARKYCGSFIDACEKGDKKSLAEEQALRTARAYNTFICSIIKNSTDWTLDNGYRTIVATLGITLDGVMRNKIGKIAEERVQRLLLEWLLEHNLICEPDMEDPLPDLMPKAYLLCNDIRMVFGSEPDISFTHNDQLLAIIEIKGGTDPAGALERYGAATKTFQHAIAENPRCKNIYIGGVFTDELVNRIESDRLVDQTYDIVKILDNTAIRENFFKEVFHHTLRLI